MNWHDYFNYDGEKLIWKITSSYKIHVGDAAGTLTPTGYISITLNGKKYRAHRIIWEMLKGTIPQNMQIDHIDGVRTNNKINNLLLTTNAGNHKNMAQRVDNTSGTTGVTYCKRTKKWKAYIKYQSNLKHLGCFENLGDAVAARQTHQVLLGFSSRHGT